MEKTKKMFLYEICKKLRQMVKMIFYVWDGAAEPWWPPQLQVNVQSWNMVSDWDFCCQSVSKGFQSVCALTPRSKVIHRSLVKSPSSNFHFNVTLLSKLWQTSHSVQPNVTSLLLWCDSHTCLLIHVFVGNVISGWLMMWCNINDNRVPKWGSRMEDRHTTDRSSE